MGPLARLLLLVRFADDARPAGAGRAFKSLENDPDARAPLRCALGQKLSPVPPRGTGEDAAQGCAPLLPPGSQRNGAKSFTNVADL